MMAQRKDQMRIIRQDAGFSAKLGFGGMAPLQAERLERPIANDTQTTESSDVTESTTSLATDVNPNPTGSPQAKTQSRDQLQCEASNDATLKSSSRARGQVIYLAVSLTTRQAVLAESWASAARCSVQFLIRRVAQGLRDEVFDEWAVSGMPEVEEPRGMRGKHPTSVTITLRPDFAADLSRRHDPLQILGLARIMGPAFRSRFQVAFDEALAKSKNQIAKEGEEK
jgi:hypothetical protein